MPDEIRVNRVPQAQPVARHDMPPQAEIQEPQKNSKAPWIVLAVVVVVIIILGVLFRSKLFKAGGSASAPAANVSAYQAVFLTNGQVYFGKLTDADSDYADLKDIYYLQVGPQQGSGPAAGQTGAQSAQSISLVKLGNELHGPVDEMHLNRAQILFYEDLKEDGQVVKAIEAYKANPTGAPSAVPSK